MVSAVREANRDSSYNLKGTEHTKINFVITYHLHAVQNFFIFICAFIPFIKSQSNWSMVTNLFFLIVTEKMQGGHLVQYISF